MKAGIVTTLITLYLPVSVFVTMLRLSTDVDLLIPDGKKVSSSLLRGADSIELDNRSYQLVSRVEKMIYLLNSEERLCISPPLVASFNTQLINQVNLRPPYLENEWEANYFNAVPRLELLDGDTTPIPAKLDTPAIISTVKAVGYEVGVERYDKSAERASLPQSATVMVDDSTLPLGVSELDAISPQPQVFTEQRLKYWFKLTDPQTRNTFLQWVEKQPPS